MIILLVMKFSRYPQNRADQSAGPRSFEMITVEALRQHLRTSISYRVASIFESSSHAPQGRLKISRLETENAKHSINN